MQRHYLEARRFVLMSNNVSLKYLFDQQNLNARKSRWLAFLSEFYFEIRHIKGKENRVADAFSRKISHINSRLTNSYQTNLEYKIKFTTQDDEIYKQTKTKRKDSNADLIDLEFKINREGFLFFKNRLYIPNSIELKLLILIKFHKKTFLGHPSYQNMLTTLRKEYFWPNMKYGVTEYLARYLECQYFETKHQHPTE